MFFISYTMASSIPFLQPSEKVAIVQKSPHSARLQIPSIESARLLIDNKVDLERGAFPTTP